jgi:ABC-type multidrug transport system permease subunit
MIARKSQFNGVVQAIIVALAWWGWLYRASLPSDL